MYSKSAPADRAMHRLTKTMSLSTSCLFNTSWWINLWRTQPEGIPLGLKAARYDWDRGVLLNYVVLIWQLISLYLSLFFPSNLSILVYYKGWHNVEFLSPLVWPFSGFYGILYDKTCKQVNCLFSEMCIASYDLFRIISVHSINVIQY